MRKAEQTEGNASGKVLPIFWSTFGSVSKGNIPFYGILRSALNVQKVEPDTQFHHTPQPSSYSKIIVL
jgi:hypothetical protein